MGKVPDVEALRPGFGTPASTLKAEHSPHPSVISVLDRQRQVGGSPEIMTTQPSQTDELQFSERPSLRNEAGRD